MEIQKTCIRCKKDKSLSQFYKHSQMADGHLNKCKVCQRMEAKERHEKMSKDPTWLKKERSRQRDKYKRLGYKEKQREWDEKRPWKKTSTYRNLSRDLKLERGTEAHHWSYKEEHLTDVFIMKTLKHRKAHKHLTFNEDLLCFETKDGEILDSRKKHLEFLEGKKLT